MAIAVVSWGFVVLGLGGIAYVIVKRDAKWPALAVLAVIAGVGGFGPSFLTDTTAFLEALHKVMTAAKPSKEDQEQLARLTANANLSKENRELAARVLTANPTAETLGILRTAARNATTDEGREVLETRLRTIRVEMQDAAKEVKPVARPAADPALAPRGFVRIAPETTLFLERYRAYLTPERLQELGVDDAAAKRLAEYARETHSR